jgi:hypothetical protein
MLLKHYAIFRLEWIRLLQSGDLTITNENIYLLHDQSSGQSLSLQNCAAEGGATRLETRGGGGGQSVDPS